MLISTNQRTPSIKSIVGHSHSNKISQFSKSLATNREDVYQYILIMVKGSLKNQQMYSQYIFSHLKNIIVNEISTNILKYTSRFIITLALLGNIHIYERFSKYLLSTLKTKIVEEYTNRMKPIFPLQLFCQQIIVLLARWLPNDYYDLTKPSVFSKTVSEMGITSQSFKFINIDKLIVSYRIIKGLGLDGDDVLCVCQKCKVRIKNNKFNSSIMEHQKVSRKVMRQRLYVLQIKQNDNDSFWKTGFEIQLSQEMSQLEAMLDKRLQEHQNQENISDSLLFYPLKQKIELLEDHIDELKNNYHKLQHKKLVSKAEQKNLMKKVEDYQIIVTPSKKRTREGDNISTADKMKLSSKRLQGESVLQYGGSPMKSVKSQPNLQFMPLQCDFEYQQCDFFEGRLSLSPKELQIFKHSLLCFDQKIYLWKGNNSTIYCLALSRKDKIKIRIIFKADEDMLSDMDVSVTNQKLRCEFNDLKYEFTLKVQDYFQPVQLKCKVGEQQKRLVLPLGYIKLLQPLPESAKETEKLTFRLTKTVKLQNPLVDSYEYLIQKLCLLQGTLDKVRSKKVTRLFQVQKLKKRLQRRYLLLGTQLLLKILNNKTQYIDIEICCQDSSLHRVRCCQLLKELIFICIG